MDLKPLKLDFDGLTQEELRAYQEILVSTIGRLKQGLFNAEAALGLNVSLMVLGDLHQQVSNRSKEIQEGLKDIAVNIETVVNEAK